MKDGIVYAAFDTTNGKYYVGQTRVGLRRRMMQHLNAARKGSLYPFHSALRLRSESFIWVKLTSVFSLGELDTAEQTFVRELDSRVPRGYNLTEGGANSHEMSDEGRQSIRLAHLGKKHTPEHNQKIAIAAIGRKLPDEWRSNISKGQRGKKSATRSESMKRAWERRRLK